MDGLDQAQKKWFIQTALAYLGTPYIWGGDDPSGFDCSGFVIECLKSVGVIAENDDYTADRLMRRMAGSQIDRPSAGALLFRLDSEGKADHVVICLDNCFQIGSSGGSRRINSVDQAWSSNAWVRIRPIGDIGPRQRIYDPLTAEKRRATQS